MDASFENALLVPWQIRFALAGIPFLPGRRGGLPLGSIDPLTPQAR